MVGHKTEQGMAGAGRILSGEIQGYAGEQKSKEQFFHKLRLVPDSS
jgi:hypothetical protein